MYDPATDTLSTKADMPSARYGGAAATIDAKLYVVGEFNKLEVYDPPWQPWRTWEQSTGTPAPAPTAAPPGSRKYLFYAPVMGGRFCLQFRKRNPFRHPSTT